MTLSISRIPPAVVPAKPQVAAARPTRSTTGEVRVDGFAAAAAVKIDSPQGSRTVTPLTTKPSGEGRPVVFFNSDETLAKGELLSRWTPTGRAASFTPKSASFVVAGSHNNAAAGSSLNVGVQVENKGKTPLTLDVARPKVSLGTALPMPAGAKPTATGYRVTLAPGQAMVMPMGSAKPNPAANPRTHPQPVAYEASVTVTGDPQGLHVSEVASHPQLKGATTATPAGDKQHHEGVFFPQVQQQPPPTLGRDNAVQLTTAGSQAQGDSHYLTPHRFEVAILGPAATSQVTFRNASGGLFRATLNGVELKLAANAAAPVAVSTMSVAAAVKLGLLEATGRKDAAGNPVYAMTVRWQPGSNCDLSLYATPAK